MRKKVILSLIVLLNLLSLVTGSFVHGQEPEPPSLDEINAAVQNLPPDEFYRAKVLEVLKETKVEDPFLPAAEQFVQTVKVEFLDGSEKGSKRDITYYPGSQQSQSKLKTGDKVMVMKNYGIDMPSYAITDRYRLNIVGYIVAIFFLLVVLLSGSVGVRSLLGLAFSITVILFYMLPTILDGKNPLFVSLIGATVIACVSIYLAHGFKIRTSLALVSTIITIAISIGLAIAAVSWAHLFGLGSEEALYVQLGQTATINLRGLLLGGIIVGLLGVLDDITTAQAAVVDELKKANPSLPFKELFKRAFSVGKEHIASLINTLALAYVGSSLPLLILFKEYKQPLHVILNSELISEEIIRTVVGSSALILAVPITTALAAYFFSRNRPSNRE